MRGQTMCGGMPVIACLGAELKWGGGACCPTRKPSAASSDRPPVRVRQAQRHRDASVQPGAKGAGHIAGAGVCHDGHARVVAAAGLSRRLPGRVLPQQASHAQGRAQQVDIPAEQEGVLRSGVGCAKDSSGPLQGVKRRSCELIDFQGPKDTWQGLTLCASVLLCNRHALQELLPAPSATGSQHPCIVTTLWTRPLPRSPAPAGCASPPGSRPWQQHWQLLAARLGQAP